MAWHHQGQAGCLFSLFVLHRAGFFVPPALRHGAVGSYPAFSPLPPTLAGGGRFIFCDTVRQREFSLSTARVHHAARCLVVSGLSSKGYSEKQPPATVSGAADLSFNSLPLPATPEKGRRGQRAEGRGQSARRLRRIGFTNSCSTSEYRGGDCREGGAVRSEAH